ncbi:MAG TPA: DUF4402 domain-containing protein [Bacteroidales bacterium]|nr:DUF4402 domain-containing protein [Bacteroidales bacterium]
MKSMKFLAALAIMMGFGFSAMAQAQSDNDNIAAKAEVVAQVNVTKVLDLQFGIVTPGVNKSISTTGSVLAGTAGTSTYAGTEQKGHFTVTKGANTYLTLALTLPANLTYLTNNLPINFADVSSTQLGLLQISGANDVPFTPSATPLNLTSGAYSAYFTATSFDVFLGGTVAPAASQVAGDYTGTITLTATYN